MKRPTTALTRLRAICLALPEAIERETWDIPTFRVRNKIFVMATTDNGLPSLWCKAPPGAQAILLLDQAGWHVSKRLSIPDNITLLPLPPKSPELNPVENIWQFMRDNWLSNRVFKSYDDILDHCCFAWNKLIDMPWKIMSIGTRDWVYRS